MDVLDRIKYEGHFGVDRMSANQMGRKQFGQRDKSNYDADSTKPPATSQEHRSERSPFESCVERNGLTLFPHVMHWMQAAPERAWPGRGRCVTSEADPKGAGSWWLSADHYSHGWSARWFLKGAPGWLFSASTQAYR